MSRIMHRRLLRTALAVGVAIVSGGGLAASAVAAPSIVSFASFPASGYHIESDPLSGADLELPDPAAVLQAGGHPDLAMQFAFSTHTDEQTGADVVDENVKDIDIDLPKGFVGNPTAIATCTAEQLKQGQCPVDSQVGTSQIGVGAGNAPIKTEVYNLVPPQGMPAQLGMNIWNAVPVRIDMHVLPDGGLRASLVNINQGLPISSVNMTLWGVPADPSHDDQRWSPAMFGYGASSGAAPTAFLSLPTRCDGTVPQVTMQTTSWQHPDDVSTATADWGGPITGCDRLAFRPTLDVQVDNGQAGGPAAYTVKIGVPQSSDPGSFQTPELKDASVTMPAGATLNPASADGLGACTDDQLGYGSTDDASCPLSSKIGTVQIATPLLPEPLTGSVFLGQPLSSDPASGQMYRLFLQVQGSGVTIKLRGSVVADPQTGRLTATFQDNPQLPFSMLTLAFKGGARAPLFTPATCGPATTTAALTPWSGGDPVNVQSTFTVSGNCDAASGFAPVLHAGMADTQAGSSSTFTLDLSRPDGQQDMSTIGVSLPPGLLGMVGSVPLCPDAQAAAGTCGAASRVGSTTVASGVGANPLYIPQSGKAPTAVYLAGPYKGAPFSLSIVVPAQAGPFDLGTVVVRAALFVDPSDAHLTVKADPLPTILGGIPLRIQRLQVVMDRPGFMVTPTNCSTGQIAGQVTSAQGATANVSSRFQMTGCQALPFNPQFSASSNGTLRFKQGAAFKVHIGMPAGDANIKSVSLRLPKELPSRLIPTINNACVLSQYVADYTKCPEDSYVGTVSATTPILPQPLVGPVYIVAPPNDVPQLKLKLFGQGIGTGVNIELSGDIIIDSGGGRSKATFDTVPDVPISSFDLDLPAGPHSILDAPNGDLCKGPITADLSIIAQNGKRQDTSPVIKVADCPKIPRAKIVSVKVSRSGVTVKVKPAAVGTLTVGGAKLVKVTKSIPRPNVTYTIVQRLSAAGKRAVARNGSVKVTPTVAYRPTNGPKTLTSKSKPVTVKGKKTVK